jgi:hypothetical protein
MKGAFHPEPRGLMPSAEATGAHRHRHGVRHIGNAFISRVVGVPHAYLQRIPPSTIDCRLKQFWSERIGAQERAHGVASV